MGAIEDGIVRGSHKQGVLLWRPAEADSSMELEALMMLTLICIKHKSCVAQNEKFGG